MSGLEQYSMRQEIKGFQDSLQFFMAFTDAQAVKHAKANAKIVGRKLLMVRKRITPGQPWVTIYEPAKRRRDGHGA